MPILCCISLQLRINIAWATWYPVSLYLLQFWLQVIVDYILRWFWFQGVSTLKASFPSERMLAMGSIESTLLGHLGLNNSWLIILCVIVSPWLIEALIHDEFFDIHRLKLWVQRFIQMLLILEHHCLVAVVFDRVLAGIHMSNLDDSLFLFIWISLHQILLHIHWWCQFLHGSTSIHMIIGVGAKLPLWLAPRCLIGSLNGRQLLLLLTQCLQILAL